jgi:cell wall-associated NlpC family hydrolase
MESANTTIRWRFVHVFVLAACLAGVCAIACSGAKAQAVDEAEKPTPNFRLVSVAQGLVIARAARGQDLDSSDVHDCSHLVHQAYASAGFEYPYASSFDLYAGNENFARVKYPQVGDLVVWPGHAGIVLNPMKHSFYSLVTTGLEAQDYLGNYWKSRGTARFYRYKIKKSQMLAVSRTAGSSRTSQVANRSPH